MKHYVSTQERNAIPTVLLTTALGLGLTACGSSEAAVTHTAQKESVTTSSAKEAVSITTDKSVTNDANRTHCTVKRGTDGTWKVNFLESDYVRPAGVSQKISVIGSATVSSAAGVKLTEASSAAARLWTRVAHPEKFATKHTDPFRAEHGYGATFAIEQMGQPTALNVTVESASKPACEVGQEVVDPSVTQELFPQGE
jgi:hypothetical protein